MNTLSCLFFSVISCPSRLEELRFGIIYFDTRAGQRVSCICTCETFDITRGADIIIPL
jgi:hypothetical protein